VVCVDVRHWSDAGARWRHKLRPRWAQVRAVVSPTYSQRHIHRPGTVGGRQACLGCGDIVSVVASGDTQPWTTPLRDETDQSINRDQTTWFHVTRQADAWSSSRRLHWQHFRSDSE